MNKNCIKIQIIILALMFLFTIVFAYIALSNNNIGSRTENIWRKYNSNAYFSGNVGIGTTSPSALLSVASTGTSTLDFGKFCIRSTNVAGTNYYLYLTTNGVLATSSTSCF